MPHEAWSLRIEEMNNQVNVITWYVGNFRDHMTRRICWVNSVQLHRVAYSTKKSIWWKQKRCVPMLWVPVPLQQVLEQCELRTEWQTNWSVVPQVPLQYRLLYSYPLCHSLWVLTNHILSVYQFLPVRIRHVFRSLNLGFGVTLHHFNPTHLRHHAVDLCPLNICKFVLRHMSEC